MTTVRRLALLLAAAPLALAGCGGNDTCPTEVATVSAAPPPGACTLRADAVVTVSLELCTKCNQSVPACEVVPPTGGLDRAYQLDTFAQACTGDGSCIPNSCPADPPIVACRFRTPAVSGTVPYDFVIFDSVGVQKTIPFTVSSSGGSLSCSG
jgi:hypothetical protein